MLTIKSEKIPIKIWSEEIDDEALEQAKNIANLPSAFHHIAIMPDVHFGYGMPIGGVMATKKIIVPNAVGVDIGCGMMTAKTSLTEISPDNLKKILGDLRKVIPVGFEHHKNPQAWEGFDRAPNIPIIQQELESARRQIGTLGGGNHFVEALQEISDERFSIKGGDHIWLMLHSGSRNFGLKTASTYHKKAQEICDEKGIELPSRDLAYLDFDSDIGREYFEAMSYAQDFAWANRTIMIERFMEVVEKYTHCDFIKFRPDLVRETGSFVANAPQDDTVCYFGIHHNFASREVHYGKDVIVHRKGATKAFDKSLGIVPGSMGTPSYIVEGLGNEESFMSSAHGAGRQMGRKEADRQITEEMADKAIEGVLFGRWHGKHDEAPQAYKDIDMVINQQKELAKPIVKLKPLMVMIGG